MLENIVIKKEVKEAIDNNKPVVALESTIISHGMPYPRNIETALECEKIARDNGVVPATIGIIDGIINIGLNENQIKQLGKAKMVLKVSKRDIAFAILKRRMGATTVAATMSLANMFGINIMATGGIGGVHRDAENTFDISADLMEFSKTPMLIVSAGIKSILDIPKTLEVLETLGVPIIGYNTFDFPAFYSSESGLKVDMHLEKESEIAQIFKNSIDLGLNNGILVANPIPRKYQIPKEMMDKYVNIALTDLKYNRIKGKKVTPYLLSRIVSLTEGKALTANIELVKNNVRVASEIAIEFCKL